MALTMTRTRTPSTLNKFVGLVANINGELEFLERLLQQEHPEDVRARLLAKQAQLQGQKAALFETIRQFDPGLEPGRVGKLYDWVGSYGKRLSVEALSLRYTAKLKNPSARESLSPLSSSL